MNSPSFAEMISTLQLTHVKALRTENDKFINSDFWYIVDHLQNDKLYHWCMLMLKKKHIIQGKNFMKVCGILTEWEQYKSWTQKQKRYIAMMLITNWDRLTLEYPHHVSADYSY